MTSGVEQWLALAVVLVSIWFQAAAEDDPAWPDDGRADDVTVLASLLIV